MQPPQFAIKCAELIACSSPCAKTRRGAVVFRASADASALVAGDILGVGRNHPPSRLTCDGSAECRKDCGRRCVHAEVQAIRRAWHEMVAGTVAELVHVKIDSDGKLEAGGGPSCWQCSREILDAGISAVWLYEAVVSKCLACDRFEDSSEKSGDRLKRCPECHADLTPCGEWKRYTAEEFHRVTCANAKGGTIYHIGGER
jgi:deoxycytidylate deaminase